MPRITVKILSLLALCLSTSVLYAGVKFEPLTLEQALKKAEQEDKLVFVDTYATWCAPCKIMDRELAKQKVGAYFNRDFINIKIDMDGSQGAIMQNTYGVVWLPTLLILDVSGEMLLKLDKVVSSDELLDYASRVRKSGIAIGSRGIHSSPFSLGSASSSDVQQDYNPEEKEEVIYIYDERESSGRPHIMYHEAYLHIQLMDGKHDRVVKKYLSTQTDWSTEKNVKFIFDFMDDVNSELFEYFINHKDRFEEVLGREKVVENLGHLINQRIEHGFPRPTLGEYIELYKYLDPKSGEQIAYQRYLYKMLEEGQDLAFIKAAGTYTKEVNPFDHQIMYQLASLRNNRSDAESFLEDNLFLMQNAVILSPEESTYSYLLSVLFLEKGDKESAIGSLKNALLHAPEELKNRYKIELTKLEGS